MVPSPNKHMQRAGTHKVLGRGRSCLLVSHVLLARVQIRRRAGADVNRWATQASASLKIGMDASAFPAR
jgi:hypothetical protein